MTLVTPCNYCFAELGTISDLIYVSMNHFNFDCMKASYPIKKSRNNVTSKIKIPSLKNNTIILQFGTTMF